MPFEIQIIRASDFVRAGVHGDFDFAASKAALAELASTCQKRGINQAILDLRDMKLAPAPIFSRDELVSLIQTFHEMGFRKKQRLAVLYNADPHNQAFLFAFAARVRGWKVAAVDNYEEAISWLTGGRIEDPGDQTARAA